MLVRLTKRLAQMRGHSCTGTFTEKIAPFDFYGTCGGMVIEVEPEPNRVLICGASKFFCVTDERIAKYYAWGVGICEHFLIDDLDAYDTDCYDEHAQIGDLLFTPMPQRVKAR